MQRRSTVRSRTGCWTCRIRRVKCDETKPACKRCGIARRVCESSPPHQGDASMPKKGKRKINQVLGQHVFVLETDSSRVPVKISRPAGNLPSSCGYEALDHLDYFRDVCLDSFAGYVDSRSWGTWVIQVSHEESAIEEAIVALTSLHRMKMATNDAQKDVWPFLRYHRAIRILNRRLGPSIRSQQVALIASIIFVIFEEQSGSHEGALKHADGGFAIMKEVIVERPSVVHTAGVFKDISKSFLRLDILFSTRDPLYQTRSLRPPLVPEIFQNDLEACEVLYDIVAHILRLSSSLSRGDCVDPRPETHRGTAIGAASIKEYLQSWHIKFRAIPRSSEGGILRTPSQTIYDGTLFSYYLCQVIVAIFCRSGEVAHESFTSKFIQALNIVSRLLQGGPTMNITTDSSNNGMAMLGPPPLPNTPQPPKTRNGRDNLSDFVAALYAVARYFRHPRVRTYVVQMLNHAGLRGAFDDGNAQQKAERASTILEASFKLPENSMEELEIAFEELNATIKKRGPIKGDVPDWLRSYFLEHPYPE
ncbi:hypothetical protein BJ875DRAFT_264460 [Amylocarpus encephaloides]|uniref:Zn(2)-C6 fungal-type domain-containing protein n=1 Tax=Amylocarpus encephaloides TaxID=45428 RepID=A0A9P8BZK0_9HELO|nr:hypothetical protein BJ875DRAFT_264460 [Amylocarpus encephaloides]